MSTKTVEFYFDYGSPATYIAYTQLQRICDDNQATLDYKPMLLGGVFKATDNQSPVMVQAKGKWMMTDLARFAQRYGVTFKMNPYFIINSLPIMRGAVWAQKTNVFDTYNPAMQQAMWVDGVDLNNPKEIGRVVTEAGLDANAMAAAIAEPDIKQVLVDSTNEAVARGAFGAPTMFVGDQMHFGQDRLDWVAQALKA
jgi:2-hydroxychromene-2-carboxylate isomerase